MTARKRPTPEDRTEAIRIALSAIARRTSPSTLPGVLERCARRRADLLNVHAGDGSGHDETLDLAGALEDRVGPFAPSAEIHGVRRDAAWSGRLSIAFSDVAVSFSAL
jgi:hypothetical protein